MITETARGGRVKKGTKTHVVIRELDAGDHEDAAVAGLPVVVADERVLARGALALGDARHAELDVWRRVERRGIKDSDTIPAALHLDGQVPLEPLRAIWVVEDVFKRRVLERGPVDVPRDPVVVKYGRALREE